MMSQVNVAPAGPIHRVRLMVTGLIAIGVVAVGLLGPASAGADVNNCSMVTTNIVCVGQVNGMPVSVTVGDVGSNNDLSALTNGLNDAFVSVANIADVNILSADLNAAVQTVVNSVVATTTTTTTRTCTVVVTPPATATQTSTISIGCA
jgi:hypothetical protein